MAITGWYQNATLHHSHSLVEFSTHNLFACAKIRLLFFFCFRFVLFFFVWCDSKIVLSVICTRRWQRTIDYTPLMNYGDKDNCKKTGGVEIQKQGQQRWGIQLKLVSGTGYCHGFAGLLLFWLWQDFWPGETLEQACPGFGKFAVCSSLAKFILGLFHLIQVIEIYWLTLAQCTAKGMLAPHPHHPTPPSPSASEWLPPLPLFSWVQAWQNVQNCFQARRNL